MARGGKEEEETPASLTCQAGFPKFPRARRSKNNFFFPLVYKHFFHPWFLIALAAALKLSVLVEHVSCVEALGGEFSNRPLAKKSVLHVETICQNGFHNLCVQGAQRLPRDVEDSCCKLVGKEHQRQLDQAQALKNKGVFLF